MHDGVITVPYTNKELDIELSIHAPYFVNLNSAEPVKVEATKNTDETLNEKMTTDLVNIHAELVATNKLLKTKIQEMYKNCMKARPDIACPQP